jgi:hypothetical protein
MNQLHVGFSKAIELPKGGFLYIHDEVPDLAQSRIFDPLKHSFNPLRDIDYKRARQLSDVLYTIAPEGENTLTVRDGKRAMLQALLEKAHKHAQRFDRIRGAEEVTAMLADILASPVLRRVFCNPKDQFSFRPGSRIFARVDRAELGDFDALVLALVLMNHFKGQLIVPDFGFYGRPAHASLIREHRLIAGLNFLGELPPRLRQAVLLIKDKRPAAALYEDAEVLARYAGLAPGTNAFNDFVQDAMS